MSIYDDGEAMPRPLISGGGIRLIWTSGAAPAVEYFSPSHAAIARKIVAPHVLLGDDDDRFVELRRELIPEYLAMPVPDQDFFDEVVGMVMSSCGLDQIIDELVASEVATFHDPRFMQGTPEHEAYCRQLAAELAGKDA